MFQLRGVEVIVICVLIFSSGSLFAEPTIQHEIKSSQLSEQPLLQNIENSDIVEGSTRFNGIQPDYFIDEDSSDFDYLWKIADQVEKSDLDIPHKVDLLVKELRALFADHHGYRDPVYLELLDRYRQMDKPVPLSQYVRVRAAVCRENALILHLLLKRAGIPNFHVYAKTQSNYPERAMKPPENHAFVVFEYKNERWIADSYSLQYNGYSFDEFLENKATLIKPKRSLFFAVDHRATRSMPVVNPYPRVNKRNNKSEESIQQCSGIFHMESNL